MSAASASPRRSYHHGDLHAALMAEGLRLLGERSEEDLSMREIARNVGVSATAVYRHFPDKGALLSALAQQGFTQLATAQRGAGASAGGGAAGFYETGRAYVRFALDNPALFRLMFGHGPVEQAPDAAPAPRPEAMEMLLENAAAVAPKGSDTRIFALQSWAAVHGLAVLMLDGLIAADPELIDAVIAPRG